MASYAAVLLLDDGMDSTLIALQGSLLVGVIGLFVTIAGFTATLIQLVRTQNAAESARLAALDAQSRFSTNHLLILLPQLERVENDLTEAVKQDNVDFAMFHLAAWRWQAGQIHALLSNSGSVDIEFLRSLQESVTLAAQAKTALLEKGKPVMKSTRRALDGITVVTDRLGALTVQLSTDTNRGSHADPKS